MPEFGNQTIGKYRLVDFIGAGGMGEVYRAVHLERRQVVALKVLSQTASGGRAADRFRNEARIQAELQHPGIAQLIEYLEYDGRPCLVLEFVDGPTLDERIRSLGPVSASRAISVMRRVAEAVAYIHERGIVHRDLKTSNVKVTPEGAIKLLDFGIARAAYTDRMTKTGTLVGTVETLAPEQIEGADADARSDVWALGLMMFELLTGRLPFEGTTIVEVCRKIVGQPAPRLSELRDDVPEAVSEIVTRCLRKKPGQRYASAAGLLEALEALAAPEADVTSGTGVAEKVWHEVAGEMRHRWRIVAATGALLFLLLGGVAIVASRNGSGSRQADSGEAEIRKVTVDVFGGSAEVFRDGRKVGETPYEVEAPFGSRVELTLRREGFEDHAVSFDVNERHVFTYPMNPVRER